jgi:two-component system response regulator FixJ
MADQRRIVMIVDNDEAVRDALQFSLRLEGLCVHVHSGGAALLADPDLDRASCIILDDRMPQMDGFALLKSLRTKAIALPAIMLTGHATALLHAKAHAAGVRTVLEKPLLDNTLAEHIRTILDANWKT